MSRRTHHQTPHGANQVVVVWTGGAGGVAEGYGGVVWYYERRRHTVHDSKGARTRAQRTPVARARPVARWVSAPLPRLALERAGGGHRLATKGATLAAADLRTGDKHASIYSIYRPVARWVSALPSPVHPRATCGTRFLGA